MSYGLVICSQVPDADATQAGHKLAYQFIKELAVGNIIDLVLIVNKKDHVSADIKQSLGLNDVKVFRVDALQKMVNIIKYFGKVPPRFCTRISPEVVSWLKKSVCTNKYKFVRYEFSQSSVYQGFIPNNIMAIMSCHDIQTQVVLRGGWFDVLFSTATYKFEERMVRSMQKVRVLSEKDSHLVQGLFGVDNVEVTSPPVGDFAARVCRSKVEQEKYSMMFWGAMNRVENEGAALKFICDIFPLIIKRIDGAKLYIVGNAPSRKLLAHQSSEIVITDYVKDPSHYFEIVHIGVVPLLRGAGVKIKTLEMLAAGIPVFSTPIGAEGIAPQQNLVVVDIEYMADRIINFLLND